jgi:hypothetical protein
VCDFCDDHDEEIYYDCYDCEDSGCSMCSDNECHQFDASGTYYCEYPPDHLPPHGLPGSYHWLDGESYDNGTKVKKSPNAWDTIEKYGIDRSLNLARECAEFYTLERLVTQGEIITSVAVMSDGRRIVERACAYPFESRQEMLWTAASRSLSSLEKRLAHSFSRYVEVACAGEARHATRLVNVPKKKHKDHVDCPLSGRCTQYSCFTARGSGSFPRIYPKALKGCINKHPEYVHTCNKSCCEKCKSGMVPKIDDFPVAVRPFFRRVKLGKKAHSTQEGSRTGSWLEWIDYRKKTKVGKSLASIQGLVDVFDMPWSSGYGGDSWRTCAEVLRDFYAGILSPRLFIDRCWTLEHNGGNVFNKVYTTSGLKTTLNEQAAYPYNHPSHGILKYCSRGVQSLWSELGGHEVRAKRRDEWVAKTVDRSLTAWRKRNGIEVV